MKSNLYDTNTEDTFYNKSAQFVEHIDPKKYEYNFIQTMITERIRVPFDYICSILKSSYEKSDDREVKVEQLKFKIALVYLICTDNNVEGLQPSDGLIDILKNNVLSITENEPELGREVLNYFEII